MTRTRDSQSLLADLLYYVPSKVIPAVLGFILVIVLTHALTPTEFGKYATILAIVNLADVVVSAWLRQSILRFYPSYQVEGKTREFQVNTLSLLIMATLSASAAASATLYVLRYEVEIIALVSGVLCVQVIFDYLVTLYQSSRLSRHYAVVTLIQSLVQLAWVWGLVYQSHGGYLFAVLGVAAGVVSAELYFLVNRGKTGIHFGVSLKNLDLQLSKSLLGYGLPMSAWLLCFQLLYVADRLIIGVLRPSEEVGIYSSAYDLINGSLSLVLTPFLLAAHPIIMQSWAKNRQSAPIEELIQSVVRYLMLLFMPIFFFSLVINQKLFLVLGQGFGIIGWVVPVLVAGVFLSGFSMYAHKGLEVAKRTRIMMSVATAAAVLNIALNFVLIGPYGYPAAAVVTLISYLFYTIVVYMFSRRYLRLRIPWVSVIRAAVAAGIAGLCLRVLESVAQIDVPVPGLGIGLSVLFCSGLYLAGLFVSGELALEYQEVLAIAKRFRSRESAKNQAA